MTKHEFRELILVDTIRDRGVFLDYPLDILLNRKCSLSEYEKDLRKTLIVDLPAYFSVCDRMYDKLLKENRIASGMEAAGAKRAVEKSFERLRELDREELRGGAFQWIILLLFGHEEHTEAKSLVDKYLVYCRRYSTPSFSGSIGSITLPKNKHPGTGNIVIRGKPGTAKSTLALQIAMSFTFEPNELSAVYFALEEPVGYIMQKYDFLPKWKERMRELRYLNDIDESASPAKIGNALLRFLMSDPEGCRYGDEDDKDTMRSCEEHAGREDAHVEPCVLFPLVAPRNIEPDQDQADGLFWDRFKQIERILQAAHWLRKDPANPRISAVCVDSLNAFGDKALTRDKVCRLFDLFRQYETIGIFVVEDTPSVNELFSSEVIDVLIDLSTEEDGGYTMRYFEIKKSRFQHQVYGRHPFKIRDEAQLIDEKVERNFPYLSPIKVIPSLHYIVMATKSDSSALDTTPFDIGDSQLKSILPPHFIRNSVLAMLGPNGTYKSPIARNFLIRGILKGESALYIRLHDHVSFHEEKDTGEEDRIHPGIWRISEELLPQLGSRRIEDEPKTIVWRNFHHEEEDDISNQKMLKRRYSYSGNNPSEKYPDLIEVAFKGGALLPEEFIEIIRALFRNQLIASRVPIRCVVLDDLNQIGVSYPFLRQSKTAGDIFLSSFVHIVRNSGITDATGKYNCVDLILVGTTNRSSKSDEIVNKAESLADSTLTTDYCDVFGDQYIVVKGEGNTFMTEREKGTNDEAELYSEKTPGIMVPSVDPNRPRSFKIDLEKLKGLVGFDTGNIHRPGLLLELFADGIIQEKYNDEIDQLMRSSFGCPMKAEGSEDVAADGEVSIASFDSSMSEAVHDSMSVMTNGPIEKTILCTVDEFCVSLDDKTTRDSLVCLNGYLSRQIKVQTQNDWNKKFNIRLKMDKGVYAMPYIANVLLLAYRTDCDDLSGFEAEYQEKRSWQTVYKFLSSYKSIEAYSESGFPKYEERHRDDFGVKYGFDHDIIAPETMSCTLIDAIVAEAARCNQAVAGKLPENPRERGKNDTIYTILTRGKPYYQSASTDPNERAVIDELKSLQGVFSKSAKYAYRSTDPGRIDKKSLALGPNAAMYLCWYSNLRELLQRYPRLAKHMKVVALPGGGFSGDWFLGIVRGSVSVKLGYDIMSILCGETEEFKRFVRGVGLPVTRRFSIQDPPDTEFYLGPYAKELLSTVLDIHKKSMNRSTIKDYRKYRTFLTTICQQLSFLEEGPSTESGSNGSYVEEFIQRSYRRIPNIITNVLAK